MKNIIRALKLVIPIAPMRMTAYWLLSLPGAILPAIMLYLQRRIVDDVAHVNQELSMVHYMKPVLLLIGTYMVMKLFQLVSNQYMEFGYFKYVFMGLDACIHKKSAQISLEYYDDAGYYKIVQNAKRGSMFLVFTANLAIMSLILMFNLLSVGGYLAALNPLLIIFVALVSVPVIMERIQGAKNQSNLMEDTAQPTRRKKYAFDLLSKGETKKELAHHGASHYVADKYLAACREIDEKEQRHTYTTWRNGIAFAAIKALSHCMAIFMMVWLLVSGRITVGGFSVLLASFSALTGTFTQLFSHAGEIMQTSVMSTSFFSLMDLEVKDGVKDMEDSEEIARLEHVSYQYPNGEGFALKDISLSINKGEKIAIVGENGAGKTTLAKLLSGFLLPTEGVLELGGTPRSQLREDSILGHINAVYQEFGRYKLTLAQNVYLSDTKASPPPQGLEDGMDMDRICDALDWAGLSASKNPGEMLLGKEFGGTELSGGQWQRVALARSYYRQRPILFLDEPTASIDPLEEMAIYDRLNELEGGAVSFEMVSGRRKTIILITHRLGAVRDADKIIVLDSGSIVEMGSFAQLIEKRGHFHHIWNEQAKWYHG